ncbi:MAG: ferritin-like domain-containing protein [Bacteroidota bacterium]
MIVSGERSEEQSNQLVKGIYQPINRSAFLKYAGAAFATSALLMAGCKKDEDTPGVDLGSGDIGILNYAYALEQLEAAFYKQVIASPFVGMTAAEATLLTEIRDHEAIHRDFFKVALGSSAIQDLEVNFSSIDFTKRESVLKTAQALEDTGVKAYNGAGKLLVKVDYLLIAGKIVSVEARHAAAIRDLLQPNSAYFAGDDAVEPTKGLDAALTPAEILVIAGPFIKTKINASNLPK